MRVLRRGVHAVAVSRRQKRGSQENRPRHRHSWEVVAAGAQSCRGGAVEHGSFWMDLAGQTGNLLKVWKWGLGKNGDLQAFGSSCWKNGVAGAPEGRDCR